MCHVSTVNQPPSIPNVLYFANQWVDAKRPILGGQMGLRTTQTYCTMSGNACREGRAPSRPHRQETPSVRYGRAGARPSQSSRVQVGLSMAVTDRRMLISYRLPPLEVVEQGSTTWVSGAPLRESRVRHYAELGFSTCGGSRVSLQVTNLVVYYRTRPYARIDGSPALIRKIPTCTAFSYPFSTSRLPEQPVARMRQRHIHRVIFTGVSPECR